MLKRIVGSIWVAEWPPFGKLLPARLAICSHCLLSICYIYLFPVLVYNIRFFIFCLKVIFKDPRVTKHVHLLATASIHSRRIFTLNSEQRQKLSDK